MSRASPITPLRALYGFVLVSPSSSLYTVMTVILQSYSRSQRTSIGYHKRVTFGPDSIRMTIMPAFKPDGKTTWYSRRDNDASREFPLGRAQYFLEPKGPTASSILTIRLPGSNGRLDASDRLAAQFDGPAFSQNGGCYSGDEVRKINTTRGSVSSCSL
jgi:hypothetical protein